MHWRAQSKTIVTDLPCRAQLTLTTRPEGGKGFQLYVDGQLAAQTLPNQTYVGEWCIRPA